MHTSSAAQLHTTAEIASQPACWRRAIALATDPAVVAALPARGERVAVVGCGTSFFMAQAYARLREDEGLGETDAFAASEFPFSRDYDRVVALSRSGTTTEVIDVLRRLRVPTTAIVGTPGTPVTELADQVVALEFADERSVVQTRFATTALVLLRAHLGERLDRAVLDAEQALADPLTPDLVERNQFTFLGGAPWTTGLAAEAALKMREASLSWAESYPAAEYRHGPIAITDEGSLVWVFGTAPEGLELDVAGAGGRWIARDRDPLAELVAVHRLAVEVALLRGLHPDTPRNLTRSVILDGTP
ncbi:Fructoselysine-6-P-deglycase FrlB with duplicated sugar isomerase (SIS) domain [Lentzea waywayandensis]|uniref:Fructoselysine-6-P-deglycase FrlB with duplicated sugar isomerase (SIS) domain n=1 Tax=Lentzea waywayandensis TaxID=84724 RepID=A0A1I6CSD6_9PSEU|nr:sugar isomerase [Lentzea waywayandensis]SFQ96052.1 Fructoselysine-6-P-deglycase FrlB with duplicated sugar isomerase (SIS) domain [Lentzea waywayandensis]